MPGIGIGSLMSSTVVLGIVVVAFAIAIVLGLMRRSRVAAGGVAIGGDAPNTLAQWTEGETTRLLSSAEVPGLYLLRPRFLSKAEGVVFLLLKAGGLLRSGEE